MRLINDDWRVYFYNLQVVLLSIIYLSFYNHPHRWGFIIPVL